MGDAVLLKTKIYEEVNNSEVYLMDYNFIVPYEASPTDKTGISHVSAPYARDEIDAPNVSLGYGVLPETMFIPIGFEKVSLDFFLNKTINIHILSDDNIDRYFKYNITLNTDYLTYAEYRTDIYMCKSPSYMSLLESNKLLARSRIFTSSSEGVENNEFYQFIPFANPKANYFANYGINIQYNRLTEEQLYVSSCSTSRSSLGTFKSWISGYEPVIIDTDNPYWDGGISEEGGGDGNFSEDSDTPITDLLPEIGAVGTGFATIFKPSVSQLRNLSGLFWNSNVFTLLQNLVENITNMFTSLAMVPFEVDAGRTVSVTWLGIDTAVSLTLAAKQYYEFDMGSINMANDSRIFTSGSVLDYSPFSKLGIYLPFIGYQDLDIDECRDAVINLRYRIDILSGACVAIIKVGGKDLYQFSGNCLTQIPITNENMQSLVSDAVNVGIAAAGVGAAAANAGSGLAEAAGSKEGIQFGDIAHAHATVNRAESGLASATVNAVIGSKPTFNKSGAISSSASMMALRQPYLFLSTPRQSIPEHYQRYRGFPSNITSKLGDLSGFTVVEDIRLNGLVATSPEVAEIYDLLKKGVII